MNNFPRTSAKFIFLVCFFLEIYHTEEINERQCADNDVTPNDELSEADDSTFNLFASQLERYTGLGQDTFSVSLNCEQTTCIVNPNGTAIWDARMYFYLNIMMSHNNDSRTTLDGCLCYSLGSREYQSCMEEVRGIMIDQLDTILVEKFKEIVESNCGSLFEQNCL